MRAKYFLVRFDYFASNHITATLALPSLLLSAFFWSGPCVESCGFPFLPPPPFPTFATSLAASKRGFFPNVYQHVALKLTGCFISIIHLLDVPKLWREVTRLSVKGRSISQALATNLAGKKVFLTRYIRSQNPPDELLEETQYKMVRVK